MDYIKQYKKECSELSAKIKVYLSESRAEGAPLGHAYFCVQAGVHQATLTSLDKGTARPETAAKIKAYFESVISETASGDAV